MSWNTLALVLVFTVTGGQIAAAQGGRAMRFQGMDRNGDGRITRAEWNGSDQSFRVHDWNGDGVLSGDEVKPGARRGQQRQTTLPDFETPDREYTFDDWTVRGFNNIDHNRDNRITADEWHFDRESFRRADQNRDGVLSRAEFLGEGLDEDDDRGDRFSYLDVNGDNRISRDEWHGTRQAFDRLDDNRDGVITRAEMSGTEPPPDLFTSVDVNRNGTISRDEWHWSPASFERRDRNGDGRLTREEFAGTASTPTRSRAYLAGHERGLIEGRAAGREDRERNQGWDLEGQRELEQADSGYNPSVGSREEYQAGYRAAFRVGYREGFGPR